MRGVKSTLILFVVLVGLGAYIYFVDSKQPLGDQTTKEKVFAGVNPDDIEELEIKAEDGERSQLKKEGEAWTIVSPITATSDAGELSSLTGALADTSVESVIDERPVDVKPFGLDPPRIEVVMRLKGKKEPQRLLVGSKTPAGEQLYAKVADQPRVFLISGGLDATFNKNTFALRDKSILKFDRSKAETIDLTSGSTVLQFAKSGTEWKIVKPVAARADFSAVEGIVERLASAQMQGVAEPEASDLRKYGLDKPAATMVVGTGSARATLTLGKTENALVYAKDAARPMVFTVAPTIKDDVFKKLDDVRRKDLFDSRSFTATRAEITRGSESYKFEKSKGKDDKDVWKDAAGKDVDATKLDEFLSRLTALRATTFESAAAPALKSPVLRATITYDENKTETVTFGRMGSDVVAARSDEGGSAKVEAGPFDETVKGLDALK